VRLRIVVAGALAGGLAASGSGVARAEGGGASNAAAEALFQEGRRLLMAGKPAEACPKLEESQRLDPATGTLMALALCREQQDRLASAWAAFVETEGRARLEHRPDREALAREHATALRPRLSTLTLRVPAALAAAPAFAMSLDGVALGRGAWNVDIPIDGGPHAVEALMKGQTVWRSTISVRPEGERTLVEVPREVGPAGSDADATVVPPPGGALPPSAPPPAADSDGKDPSGKTTHPPATDTAPARSTGSWSAQRRAAVVVAALGAIAVGAGVYVALDAKRDYDRAIADCPMNSCPDGPYAQVMNARRSGDVATVVSVVGGAAILSGVALWLLAPSEPTAKLATNGPWIERVGLTTEGAVLTGHF
jgi:hypothetical protein